MNDYLKRQDLKIKKVIDKEKKIERVSNVAFKKPIVKNKYILPTLVF